MGNKRKDTGIEGGRERVREGRKKKDRKGELQEKDGQKGAAIIGCDVERVGQE